MERSFIVFSKGLERLPTREILARMTARGADVEWRSGLLDATPEEEDEYASGAFHPRGQVRDTTRIEFSFQTAEDHFVVDAFRDEVRATLKEDALRDAFDGTQAVYRVSVRASMLSPERSFESEYGSVVLSLLLVLVESAGGLIEDEDGSHHLSATYPAWFRIQ